MSGQAFHGGRLAEAAREFNRPPDSFIDFSANLNVWAPEIDAAEWAQMRVEILHYPEAASHDLRRRLADVYDLPEEFIVPTAGGIEALYLAARLLADKKIAVIEPSFSDNARAVRAAGGSLHSIILREAEWHGSIFEWRERLLDCDVVIFTNPNNPTGACWRRKDLLQLIRDPSMRSKAWIIDEAFVEFATGVDAGLLPVLAENENIIVLRSLTKSWRIPGLRLGFLATASEIWRGRVEAMQPPWSINSPAQAWARRRLNKQNYHRILRGLEGLPEIRIDFVRKLSELGGLRIYPSAANFILVRLGEESPAAGELYRLMGRDGFLIRVCDSFTGMEPGRFVRLAVRTSEENRQLVTALAGCRARVEEMAAA